MSKNLFVRAWCVVRPVVLVGPWQTIFVSTLFAYPVRNALVSNHHLNPEENDPIRGSLVFFLLSALLDLFPFQLPSAVDRNVVLQASLASDQTQFHIGERIPLRLAFSSAVANRYEINMAKYDRSGRMNYEQFELSPGTGAVDPLQSRLGGIGGGLTNFQFLSPEPWTITLNLNEWLRFTQPGTYRLSVNSYRVSVKDSASGLGTSPILVRSNEVTFKIVPATKDWQRKILTEAVAVLDLPAPSKPPDLEKYVNSSRQALEDLRFLGTAEATSQLAKRLRGENLGGLDYVCMLGLLSSPDSEAARRALERELADPDHPISDIFINTLRTLYVDVGDPHQDWKRADSRAVEALIAALPAKRGKALATSLGTAVNMAWNSAGVSEQTTKALVDQTVSLFDQLPLEQQNTLLTYRWDKIGGPNMLPILRRYAEAYQDFPQMREMNAYRSLELSATALKHWYELDPAGARPAIIREITRPRPRFGARILGILPDKTIPELDFALADHLAAASDFDGLANIASLIGRYATDAILPQVTARLDPLIGKWACGIQDPLLAYLLRVNPSLARPRIEQAVAARGKDFSACNHGMFQSIAEIYYGPTLEEIGTHSLNDPDPQVAMTAATMLGKYGSPAAESPLRESYAAWTAAWTGRESELDLTFADSPGERGYQLGLGENLAMALATAKSWLMDQAALQRLAEQTHVKRVRDHLDDYLKTWQNRPIIISVHNNPAPLGLEAQVVQYEFHSVDELESTLIQFPAGTEFLFQSPAENSTADNRTLAELRTFLIDRGNGCYRPKAHQLIHLPVREDSSFNAK